MAGASNSSDVATIASQFAGTCPYAFPNNTCDAVKLLILGSMDGNLAKRAAGLCVALGNCSTLLGCRVTVNTTSLSANATTANATANATEAALDLCTVEGIVGGKPVYPAVNTTGVCARVHVL